MFLECSSYFSNCIVTARKVQTSLFIGSLSSLLRLTSVSFGQNATIVGTVTDPSGAVMPNVNITVTNTETSWARTIPTKRLRPVRRPEYSNWSLHTVKAEASGFKIAEQKDVVLSVGDRLR